MPMEKPETEDPNFNVTTYKGSSKIKHNLLKEAKKHKRFFKGNMQYHVQFSDNLRKCQSTAHHSVPIF